MSGRRRRTAAVAVMVWLHGEGVFVWLLEQPAAARMRLCRRGDVDVVTTSELQQLDIFGHLDLSEVGGESRGVERAGTLDMIATLHWVRDNIGAFSGDPGCVTIFGESGSGGKVSTLLAMPSRAGCSPPSCRAAPRCGCARANRA